MDKRIVVTGMGCITPLGHTVATTWEAALAGQSGVGPITLFDAREHETRIAAEVKDFDPAMALGRKEARRMDRYTQLAMVAAQEAIAHARLEITPANRDRIGVFIGSAFGGLGTALAEAEVYSRKGPRRVSPFLVPMMLADSAGGLVAITFGLRGPNLSILAACATGTNAIGEAAAVIRRGEADVMIAGGAEAAILPLALAGFNSMGALSTRNETPEKASRPFDKNRDGFVPGEGGAVLVLESEAHALTRGATLHAEILGYGHTNDAYHVSAPAEDSAGMIACMRQALQQAGVSPAEVDYLNAHGTSTPLNDKSETAAIKAALGERANQLPISSTKSMTGHLLGAAGALEAIFCVKVIADSVLPPTINCETPDPECDLDYVPNQARPKTANRVMSNSFGFGGHNACLVLGRYSLRPAQ